jgi:hypothetical protein
MLRGFPDVYPFIDYLQKTTGEPLVYLVEDNAPSYSAAKRVDHEPHLQKGFITFDWPAKSPDLNKIEPVWDYEKDEISTYQFTGACQETIADAKATLLHIWNKLPQEYIDRMCLDFHSKLELVKKNNGNNNFNG